MGLGAGYYMFDYAMLWTIRMLYLVEYADWDSQKVIGFGCGDGSAIGTMGYTDSMTYHTGTTQSTRDTYGLGTQYRYIEGLWDNCDTMCDGVIINAKVAYVSINPTEYNDTSTFTRITRGPADSGCISSWEGSTTSGLEWALVPKTVVSNSSYNTYCADSYSLGNTTSTFPMRCGGSFSQGKYSGLFNLGTTSATSVSNSTGPRLQYLP